MEAKSCENCGWKENECYGEEVCSHYISNYNRIRQAIIDSDIPATYMRIVLDIIDAHMK